MVSTDHEALADLFRRGGGLAPELLRLCSAIELAHHHVEIDSADLTQSAPTEYRADSVVRLCDRHGKTLAAVIIEVQISADDDKCFSWPEYVAALHARLRCPVYLLVVAPDPRVAAWARKPIEIGHPGLVLRPIVVAFGELPRIVNAIEANKLPELAVLSALAHADKDIAAHAISATSSLPEDAQRLYTDLILSKLPDGIRKELEARMIEGYVYRSDFARKYYGQGLEEGKAEGRITGERETLQATIRDLAQAKIAPFYATDERRLERQHDIAVLKALILALAKATSSAAARAAFDAAIPRSPRPARARARR